MANWTHRVKHFDPPQIQAQSAYSLEGIAKGKTVYVLAPGPSFDDYSKDKLKEQITIGVNSIVEIFEPTYALWQEGILCKKYFSYYSTGHVQNLVTTWSRANLLQKLFPKGRSLYAYESLSRRVLSGSRDCSNGRPWWYDAETSFLPGKNSVAFNAMSLAVIMGAAQIVLVGVDMYLGHNRYYATGITKNRGPKNQILALAASRAWGSKAAARGVWTCTGAKIKTTSPWLKFSGISRI